MNRKINHIHERALRLVYNDYNSIFKELLDKDNSVCIHHRNLQYLAIEMFKVKNNLSPQFMQELFTYIGDGHRTRAGSDRFLRPNVATVNNGEKSLRNFGPILWNTMLPDELKRCTSLEIFKEKVKFWVPDMCKCTLCKTYIGQISNLCSMPGKQI